MKRRVIQRLVGKRCGPADDKHRCRLIYFVLNKTQESVMKRGHRILLRLAKFVLQFIKNAAAVRMSFET